MASNFSVIYTFTNNTLDPLFINPSAVKPAILSSCTFSPTGVSVSSHQSKQFTLTCTGSADGTGTVTVTADEVSATVSVTVESLNITPKGTTVVAVPSTTNRQEFIIQNLGAVTDTVDVVTSCAVYSCTLQTPTPLVVSAGTSKRDTVQYTAGGVGTQGTVGITGTVRGFPSSSDAGSVTAQVPSPLAPIVSLTPHNGDNHFVGLCVAGCFDVRVSYSTPAYTSMDTPRSATLLYSSGQAHPMGFITVDVSDTSARHAQKFSLQLRQSNGSAVTFTSGTTELFFAQDSAVRTRLSGQFDATSLGTGVQLDTVIVKSIWTTGVDAGTVTQASAPVPILIVNEQSSALGAGWTLGGLQRVYFPSDTTMLLVTDGAESITRFTRPCQGCLATATAADFSTLIQTKNGGGTVTGYLRTYRDGSTAVFNTTGYLTSTENRFTDTTKFAYDASNHIQTITDPSGKTLTFAYVSNKLSTITDPNGRVSSFSVNASGDLASIGDPTATTTFQGTYDAQHRLTQRTDRGSNTWKYVYDFAGKIASDSTPSVTVDTALTGTGTLVTRRLGHKTVSLESVVLIDPASGKGSSTTPGTQVVSTAVRAIAYGVPLETTTAHTTRYMLDRFFAPLQIERDSLADTTFITRDASEHVTASLERRKRKTVASSSATYNGPRLTQAADALSGSVVNYTYDTTFDLVKRVTGTTQTVQNYLNAAKSRIDSMRVGSNADTTKDSVTVFAYDTKGRITTTTDPRKDKARAFFGTTGFQNTDSTQQSDSTLTSPRTTRFRYDGWGRVVRTMNPRGDSAIVAMDKLNRVDTVTAPGGSITTYLYDSLSNVRQLTDAKSQTYAYHYNALGWADTVTDAATSDPAGNRKDAFEFTKTGAVRKHVNRRLQPTTTTFNHQGQDSTVTLSDGRVTRFAYDTAGLWAADSNSESIDTVRTDTAGLVLTQITARGTNKYILTATSDANGLVRSRVATLGTDTVQKIGYGYDANFRLDTMRVGPQRTYFGYNADGLMTFLKLSKQPSNTTLDSISYQATAMHKGYSVTHSAATLTRFNSGYTRDSLEHITQRTHGDTAWSYAYDALGRVNTYKTVYASGGETCIPDSHHMDGQICTANSPVTLQTTSFNYDSVGNRVDGSPTIIAGNRLTSWNGYTLTYDYDGNLTHKQNASTGFDQYLYWNSIGQLDSVKTNSVLVSFGYDGFGRRVRKTDSTAVYKYAYKYVYDGDQILTIDSAGTRVRTYSYYPGVDRPHSMVTSSGKFYYYISEVGAGHVLAIIDTTGTVVNRYGYSPFGLLEDSLENPPNAVSNTYRFTGREYDPETRLYFYRARYYDPALARFISEDPIGQNGGLNQYGYALNDPINHADPTGTDGSLNPADGMCFMHTETDSRGCGESGGEGNGSAGGDPNASVQGTRCSKQKDGSWDCQQPVTCYYSAGAAHGSVDCRGDDMPSIPFYYWSYGRWCGAGGNGSPINDLDVACMRHDFCYLNAGATDISYSTDPKFSSLPAKQQFAIQGCNQQLCNAASMMGPLLPGTNPRLYFAALEILGFFSSSLIIARHATCR